MPFVKDPLTNCADAFIKLIQTDTLASVYNWTEWDSDAPKAMPRGYINIEFTASTVEAGGPISANVEMVLEGKPKRQKLSSVMGEIFGLFTDPALHRKLNALTTAIQFYRQAENLSISQRIEGIDRVIRFRFTIQILPLI